MRYDRIDHRFTPSRAVGTDPRRACAEQPTWYWFALPLRRKLDEDEGVNSPDFTYTPGDDYAVRKLAHERALITCAHCPLVVRCLQASWHSEEYGTYGAVSETERFLLGGRGRMVNVPRSVAVYEKTLAKIAKRFGSVNHPAVRWIVDQGLPRGLSREEPLETEGAA